MVVDRFDVLSVASTRLKRVAAYHVVHHVVVHAPFDGLNQKHAVDDIAYLSGEGEEAQVVSMA